MWQSDKTWSWANGTPRPTHTAIDRSIDMRPSLSPSPCIQTFRACARWLVARTVDIYVANSYVLGWNLDWGLHYTLARDLHTEEERREGIAWCISGEKYAFTTYTHACLHGGGWCLKAQLILAAAGWRRRSPSQSRPVAVSAGRSRQLYSWWSRGARLRSASMADGNDDRSRWGEIAHAGGRDSPFSSLAEGSLQASIVWRWKRQWRVYDLVTT
jgi:hypothetical protein